MIRKLPPSIPKNLQHIRRHLSLPNRQVHPIVYWLVTERIETVTSSDFPPDDTVDDGQ